MLIGQLRNRLFFRLLITFMGAVFLNGVVDPPDLYSDAVAEDLSYNEMESILEVLIEGVFQCEDFFEEYDDDDASKTVLKKRSSTDLFVFRSTLPTVPGDQACRNKWTQLRQLQPDDVWHTPLTPPPDCLLS
jgi:hypothetical protein